MAASSIYIICSLLILAQIIYCQPADNYSHDSNGLNDYRSNSSAVEKLRFLILENLIPQQHAANAVNVTQQMLKDEALTANNEPAVLEFKNNLTLILDAYDPSTLQIQSSYKVMDTFANLTHYYLHLPERQVTRETKFIIDILKKYNCSNVAMKKSTYFAMFYEKFITMFEDGKQELEKPILVWFDKFTKATDFSEKLALLVDFLLLY